LPFSKVFYTNIKTFGMWGEGERVLIIVTTFLSSQKWSFVREENLFKKYSKLG
jgi:hypothetical protein